MTPTDVNVREMRWPDIEQTHRIEVRAFPQTAWSVETFWSELAGVPETRHYVVAETPSNFVGYAGLMAVGADADVQTLAVAPEFLRRGVGGQLLQALVEEARRRECSRITLEVAATSEPAQQLYRHHGFEVIARRSGYYGPGADALIMRRRLRPGSGS